MAGDQQPTFTLQIYESDKENGPWLKSVLTGDSNSVFLLNSKPYIKIELTIFSEIEDLSTLGILLYVNVSIDDPITPVISDSARNILRNFPTWMDLYEDSIEQATPEIATPRSVGGKFVSSLVGHYLDDLNTALDVSNINSFINTADINIPAWGYVTYNVPAAAFSFVGDSIKLAKSSSLESFHSSKTTDYIYYHNLLDSQIITLRKYNSLTIDGSTYLQEPFLLFNLFDEFGARVGLKRLDLEDNLSFKQRILDTYINPPSVNLDGFKKTLRRELDIWRVYGSTPDSNYPGATPEVLEIKDIESSTPYFADNGIPENLFYNFVKEINEKYPFNLGYTTWDENIWDYAGINNEGVVCIPSVYDNETFLGSYFQPGVGDFADLNIEISQPDSSTVSFEGFFAADGFRSESVQDYYEPIRLDYSYRAKYTQQVPDPYAANPDPATPFNAGVALVYEISMPPHNLSATPEVFFTNLNYKQRNDFFVYNYYDEDSPQFPEWNKIQVVDSNSLTNKNIIFKEKTYNYNYENIQFNPRSSSIDIRKANLIKIVNKVEWDVVQQKYVPVPTGQYRVSFDESNVSISAPSVNSFISLTTPNNTINYITSNFKIGSTVYGSTPTIKHSNIIKDTIIINQDNDPDVTKDEIIYISDLKKNLVIPTNGTPNYLIIDVEELDFNTSAIFTVEDIYSGRFEPENEFRTTQIIPEHGGKSYFPITDIDYFVSSSPNIIVNAYKDTDLIQPTYSDYFESATFSYSDLPNFLTIRNNLSSTPNYPFKAPVWLPLEDGELRTTPMIKGYVDHLGKVYRNTEVTEENNVILFDGKNRDTFLDTYFLTRKDFGLTTPSNDQYFITEIKPVSLNKNIVFESSQQVVLSKNSSLIKYAKDSSKIIEELYNSSSEELYFSPIDINVDVDDSFRSELKNSIGSNPISMNTGWLNFQDEQNYVYSKPILDLYEGKYFENTLSGVPRQGAPIIVSVKNQGSEIYFEEMAFSDEATPGKPVFNNTETIKCSEHKALYLSHLNVENITIKDNFTGKVLTKSPLNPEVYVWNIGGFDATPGFFNTYSDGEFYVSMSNYIMSSEDNYSYTVNKIEVYEDLTTSGSILVPGREYEVSYSLAQAFYVENNIYSQSNDKYYSKIYFSSTPNSATSSYQVLYESAIQETSTPLGLNLNTSELSLEEGYVYVSKDEYDFGTAIVEVSPQQISKSIDDIVYVTITSYDIAGNPKPYQTFKLSSDLLALQDEYLTTNKYGLAKTKIRFTGVPTLALKARLIISGVSYPSEYAHPNSESGFFLAGEDVQFIHNYSPEYQFQASVSRSIIESDGMSENYIYGNVMANNNPPSSTPIIYWRKARTLYDLLNTVQHASPPSMQGPGRTRIAGYTHATPDGTFSIGPFYSQARDNSGYWFVAIETEMVATPSVKPDNIYGDIVHWYERADNIQYSDEQIVLPSYYKSISEDKDIIATPSFKFNLIKQDFSGNNTAKINWLPPKWVPINYYEQYQMGLFGSTPNFVATPNYIVGYEES